MATKDWKKKLDNVRKNSYAKDAEIGEIRYVNSKNNGTIIVFIDTVSKLFPTTVHTYWFDGHKLKHFKTKSQALKFARAYMRKH